MKQPTEGQTVEQTLTKTQIRQLISAFKKWKKAYSDVIRDPNERALHEKGLSYGICGFLSSGYLDLYNWKTAQLGSNILLYLAEELYINRILPRIKYVTDHTNIAFICRTPYSLYGPLTYRLTNKQRRKLVKQSLWIRYICVDALIKTLEKALT